MPSSPIQLQIELCQECQGSGIIDNPVSSPSPSKGAPTDWWIPCETCGGTGFRHFNNHEKGRSEMMMKLEDCVDWLIAKTIKFLVLMVVVGVPFWFFMIGLAKHGWK